MKTEKAKEDRDVNDNRDGTEYGNDTEKAMA
jgi:hypothetical protein